MSKSKQSNTYIIYGLIFLVFAIVFSAINLAYYNQYDQGRNWPEVNATINKAETISLGQEETNELNYTYTVDSETYTGKSSTGNKFVTELTASVELNKLGEGSTVAIHYNPLKPEESILNPEVKLDSTRLYLLFGGIVFTGSITAIVYGLVSKFRSGK